MMHRRILIIVIAVFAFVSCAPQRSISTSQPAIVDENTVTSIPLSSPTSTFVPVPTITPTLSPETLAEKMNFPIDCIGQFPALVTERGFWRFAANSSKSDGLVTDFNTQVGDLLFYFVIKIDYINANGQQDFVYVPGLTFNTATKQTIVGSTMVNNDGMALSVPARKQDAYEFVLRYLSATYIPTSYVYFGFSDNYEVNASLSSGFFNSAIDEIYTHQMIDSFMQTGDSSVLPYRLLIIYQNSTASYYCEN